MRKPHLVTQSRAASATGGRHAKVHLSHGAHMVGVVKDGHFHVHDTVYHGRRHSELTGSPPSYRPIKLSVVAARGGRIEYLSR